MDSRALGSFPPRIASALLVALLAAAPDARAQHEHGPGAPPAPPTATGKADPEVDELRRLEMGAAGRAEAGPETAATAETKARFAQEYRRGAETKRRLFAKYLPALGAQGMLDVLEQLHPFCHGEAHELGQEVFAHYRELGPALAACGDRCSSACLHGVLKEAFGSSTLDAVVPRLAGVCKEGAMAEIQRPGNCAHGVGHALMLIAKNDPERSLAGCAGFKDPAMEYYCATGVFMELFDHQAEWPEGKSDLWPCDAFTRYPAACYRYQAGRLLQGPLQGDRGRLAALCASRPPRERLGCHHGLGFASLPALLRQPSLMKGLCPAAPAGDQAVCVEGAVESLTEYNPTKASFLCGFLDGEAAEVCKAAAKEGTYRLAKPSLPYYLGAAAPGR